MAKQDSIKIIQQAFIIIAVSALQVGTFLFIYEVGVEFAIWNYGNLSKVFGFGMQFDVGVNLLSIMALINSLVHYFIGSNKVKWGFTLAAAVAWTVFWVNIQTTIPNRYLFIVIAGVTGLLFGGVFLYSDLKKRGHAAKLP